MLKEISNEPGKCNNADYQQFTLFYALLSGKYIKRVPMLKQADFAYNFDIIFSKSFTGEMSFFFISERLL